MDNTERSDSVYVNTYVYVNIQILSKTVGKEWQLPPVYLNRREDLWITHQVMRVMGVHQNDLK